MIINRYLNKNLKTSELAKMYDRLYYIASITLLSKNEIKLLRLSHFDCDEISNDSMTFTGKKSQSDRLFLSSLKILEFLLRTMQRKVKERIIYLITGGRNTSGNASGIGSPNHITQNFGA